MLFSANFQTQNLTPPVISLYSVSDVCNCSHVLKYIFAALVKYRSTLILFNANFPLIETFFFFFFSFPLLLKLLLIISYYLLILFPLFPTSIFHSSLNFISYYTPLVRRDNAVGIAAGYGMHGRGIGVRVPVGRKIFSSSRRPGRFLDQRGFLS
jgi:hypothetical protein